MRKGRKANQMTFSSEHRAGLITEALVCPLVTPIDTPTLMILFSVGVPYLLMLARPK